MYQNKSMPTGFICEGQTSNGQLAPKCPICYLLEFYNDIVFVAGKHVKRTRQFGKSDAGPNALVIFYSFKTLNIGLNGEFCMNLLADLSPFFFYKVFLKYYNYKYILIYTI